MWGVGAVVTCLLILGGSSTAYAVTYSDRAFPRTVVAGVDLSGMTREQATQALTRAVDEMKFSTVVDGKTLATPLAKTGAVVDVDATIDEVFSTYRAWWKRVASLVSPVRATVHTHIDADAFDRYVGELIESTGKPTVNAAVALNSDGSAFEVTPAQEGKAIDRDQLSDALSHAATTLDTTTVDIAVHDGQPTVTDAQAQTVAEHANAIVALNATITDGIEDYTATAADKAKWVTIEAGKDSISEPTINADAVNAWVKQVGESTNVEMQPGIHNVNIRGDVVSTPDDGVIGYTVNNIDAVASAIVTAFTNRTDYSGDFDYDRTEPTFTERLIADGAENLIYQAAPGEHWVDINLSNATVTAYEGATVVQGPMPMVPGAPGMETVTGVFKVWHKTPEQTMSGYNLDGSRYSTPGVPWVTYFHGNYAMHGAPWRTSFGWSGPGGSHGCVNMRVSDAEYIYHFAPVGTIVVSHY